MIYVDALQPVKPYTSNEKVPGCFIKSKSFCHLWCDAGEEEQLHNLAARIGMKRSWYQENHRYPHYDLVAPKRQLAINAGAVELSFREWLRRGNMKRLEVNHAT